MPTVSYLNEYAMTLFNQTSKSNTEFLGDEPEKLRLVAKEGKGDHGETSKAEAPADAVMPESTLPDPAKETSSSPLR